MSNWFGIFRATPPTLTDGQQAQPAMDNAGRLITVGAGGAGPAATSADPGYFVQEPVTASAAAVLSAQTPTAAGSLVVKASAGNLYGFEVCTGGSAGYLMVFDATAVPADGTVTPKLVYAVAANTSFARQVTYPFRCSTGITLVFSTTGPFTKTISATAFLAGHYV